ncbi:toll-like receptor 13 isoform X2 [Zootermopsis nevadensis]|nr:toll-like receptor 13 isoform X2 [Zootermopsis nevadensis]
MDEVCNCTFTNSTGFIFSCNGEYMDDLPNLGSEVPVDRLRLYAVRNARNVHQIKSYQFSGYRTKEIRIEYIEALHLEDRAFEGVLDLETLKLTHNNFGKIGQPELIFAGLVNLTTLDLSYNQLTGWKSRGKSPSDTPVLPKLTTLDLSGNPLEYLHNDTFEWLRGSQLQHLNLRKCNIKSVETGTLDPVQSTIRTIDIGNSMIPRSLILNLILALASKSALQGMALSKIGLTYIPYNVLKMTSGTLQYLSLHGNTFRNLSKDHLKRSKKLLQQQAMQKNSTLSVYDSMLLQTPNRVFPSMLKLEELDLSKCSIYYIEREIFTKMPYLKSLLLSQNQLISFSILNLPSFSHLLYLDLSNNPLYLNSLNFTHFPVLTTLDLSYTNGKKIFKNTFQTSRISIEKLSMCYSKLSYIEDDMFINFNTLKVLDLSGNINLGQHLSAGTFNGLVSLEELHLAECTLKVLSKISLEHNTTIEIDLLQSLTSLKRINLAKNDITNITSNIVETLTELDSLDLSNNYIRSWNEPVFKNTKLRNLNVAHNHFNYITDAMLKDFRSLKVLIVSSNPFVCDCNCLKFLEITENITANSESNQHKPPDIQTKSRFKVAYPARDTSNYFISDWDDNDAYICLDKTDSDQVNYIPFQNASCDKAKVQPQTPAYDDDDDDDDTDANEVNNYEQAAITAVAAVLIVTIVVGITYWKWWYIRYFAILVKNATVLSFMAHEEDASTDHIFNYDIFTSYSDHNREWVLNSLLPNLESKSKVKVCLHERDFQVGISILENIISSIDRSRCILLVISQPFLRSQWCQFELHLAQHRLLETRREELILLFLEEIPRTKRPKTLEYLMKTKTYILWPKEDDVEGQKLFWKRLHRAILRCTAEKEKKHSSTV